MKTQINEAKRMQQLAGILKEAPNKDITNTAMSFSNTSPNTSPGATAGKSPSNSTVNTADEKRLRDAIEINNLMISRLEAIGDNVGELDGFFKTILDFTSINNVSKSAIISSLVKALKELSPKLSTITTKKSND